MSSRALIALCVALTVTGCASQGVGSLAECRASAQGDDARPDVEAIHLPAGSELVLAPLHLHLVPPPLDVGERLRAQLVLRGIRSDGAVAQWFVGADGRAPMGERGFQLDPRSPSRAFGGADYGPIRVDSLAAIEVGVALLPLEPKDTDRFVGLGALSLDAGPEGLDERLSLDGATVMLLGRWPVRTEAEHPSGQFVRRLVLAGPPIAGCAEASASWWDSDEDRPLEFDGAQLRAEAGRAVSSSLVLELRLDVPDHK